MGATSDWIASLTERCLHSYIHTSVDGVQWEDDGSNIRFFEYPSPTVTQALIKDWIEKDGPLRVDLTDSRNQVEAILPRYALRQYRKEIGSRELSRWGTRGYPMTLLEFEVVVEYSASRPTVHFYVERFRIEWDFGRHNIDSRKLLKNDRGIFDLLLKAFSRAKERQQAKDPAIPADGDESDTSITSQSNANIHLHASKDAPRGSGISQEAFVSQVPVAVQPTASDTIPAIERVSLSKKTELLGHLWRRPIGSEGGSIATTNHVDQQGVNLQTYPRLDGEHETQGHRSNRRPSKEVDEPSNLTGHRTDASTHPPEIMAPESVVGAGTRDLNFNADSESLSVTATAEKGVNGTSGGQRSQESDPQDTNADSPGPDNTEPQVETTIKRTEAASSHNNLNHVYSHPWSGMARILARDIRISDDQKNLLENKRCWVPPSPGIDLPRGHVPPSLLARWNKIVAQRNSSTQDKQPCRTTSGTLHAGEISSPRSTNSSTPMDSDWGTPLSWDPSPSNRGPRNELPADSSPIRKRAWRQIKSPNANQNSTHVDQPLRHIDHDRVGDIGDNNRDSSHADQDQMNASTSIPVNMARPEQLGDESDGESDSPMDTSVPCALGALTQQTQSACQSEQEVTSSGPSLPKLSSQGLIQVIETPAADLSRLRPNSAPHEAHRPSKDGWEESSQQQSSQVGKSSSGSRVMNTYGSNGSEARGYQPQEAPNLSLDEHGFNIDVMGTQVTGVSSQVEQATPQSQTGLVPDSSEARLRERSASISASAPQAASFSTYREAPFSQSTGSSQDHGFFSSLGEIRSEDGSDNSRIFPLKRSAAEIECGHPSPKRYKSTIHQHCALRKASMVDTKISDALRAYEKFRNDYPRYSGDFAHFTELSHKLQCLRAGGRLTRSFLWDDFVIMHLQEYPRYLERCHASKAKSLAYEEYFISTFSKPLHRRRSLTPSAIDLGAAQYLSADQRSSPASPTPAVDEANPSFTHSLADKFSRFHAHSAQPRSSARSGVNVDRMPSRNSFDHRNLHQTAERGSEAAEEHGRFPTGNSSVHRNFDTSLKGRELDASKGHDTLTTDGPSGQRNRDPSAGEQRPEAAQGPDRSSPAKSATNHRDLGKSPSAQRLEAAEVHDRLPTVDSTSHRRRPGASADESESVKSEKQSSNIDKSQQRSSAPDPSQEIKEEDSQNSIPETASNPETEEEIDVKMEDAHDRASIQLGDADHAPTSLPRPHSNPENAAEPEPEEAASDPPSVNENWFAALRHIRPSGPVWSDDRNTPFKAWARADLNVLSERRRRGGRYLAVDENGVIQRTTSSSTTGH